VTRRWLLTTALAFVLAGCASAPPVDTKDETRSLVFGYFDMTDAPSGLEWVSLRKYDSAQKAGQWYGLAVRDGLFFHVGIGPGSYQVEKFGGMGGIVLLTRRPFEPEEQTFRAGWDVFNKRRHHIGRAILFMSDQPRYQERTGDALNPPLEETYFLTVPRSRRFMVKGSVTMERSSSTSVPPTRPSTSARSSCTATSSTRSRGPRSTTISARRTPTSRRSSVPTCRCARPC